MISENRLENGKMETGNFFGEDLFPAVRCFLLVGRHSIPHGVGEFGVS
jgi:hypothetical protein